MAVRITFDTKGQDGKNLEYFVVTGSLDTPVGCMADNNNFPYVRDVYFREMEHQDKKGVHVTIRFEEPARGEGIAVNIHQDNMTGDYSVYPLH
ncbi:hypothetical protein ACMX2M_03895 [Paenibacillus polymyxa]